MSKGTNLYVINGKIYSIEKLDGKWIVFMNSIDIAELATEHLAESWIRDRQREKELSDKTNKLIDSL